ncbi:MAG: SIMPL domain-containing protein [Bacillota bacterium]
MRGKLSGMAILSLGLILSAVIFGLFFYQSRMPEKTIRVVGAATKRFGSDIIKWRITISRNTGTNDIKNGYSLVKNDLQTLIEMLKTNGINEKDLTIQPVNTNPIYAQYERGNSISGYAISQSLYLISKDVATVEKLALNPSILVDRGIYLQSSSLEYYSSQLDKIKKELLAAATKDAKKRAERIAGSTGDRIAKIESARVGVFQITEPYSTEVSDYGVYNTSTKEKDITVTMNVVFSLK